MNVNEKTPLQIESRGDVEANDLRKRDESRRLVPEFSFTQKHAAIVVILSTSILFCVALLISVSSSASDKVIESAAWSAKAQPFSTVDPTTLGVIGRNRPSESMPGPIFGDLLNQDVPLPTNSWYENLFLGYNNNGLDNKVFQVPYILDTGSSVAGIRTHPCHVQADAREIMVCYVFLPIVSLFHSHVPQ